MRESSKLVGGGGRSWSEHTHSTACTVYVEIRDLCKSLLPSHHVRPGDWAPTIKFGSEHLYLLSHLSCHPARWTLIRSMWKTHISGRSPRCCFFCRWSQIRSSRLRKKRTAKIKSLKKRQGENNGISGSKRRSIFSGLRRLFRTMPNYDVNLGNKSFSTLP